MIDWIKIGAGVIAGAAIMYFPAYMVGKEDGRQAERVARLEADVDAYKKREGIENEVGDMDNFGVCIELGGMPHDCRELFRMEEAADAR